MAVLNRLREGTTAIVPCDKQHYIVAAPVSARMFVLAGGEQDPDVAQPCDEPPLEGAHGSGDVLILSFTWPVVAGQDARQRTRGPRKGILLDVNAFAFRLRQAYAVDEN